MEHTINRREYSRIDIYIPLEYRHIGSDERNNIQSRISGEVILANFTFMPPEINHPLMACLSRINIKLDHIIQMMTLQSEGFHSLPFKFVTLSGSGMQFSSHRCFSLSDIIEFKMILTLFHSEAIYVYGEVVRVGRQDNGYYINVRFTDITDSIRDKIIRFIFETERKILREGKNS